MNDRSHIANPSEYEDYVQEVIQQLHFWKGAKVSRNKRFPGVRQPGEYEIDIAFELFLSELVFFRLIVECKNYTRPVTRPVVQKLAQTRDAIGAHKAAIASPSGYSKEAIEVAQALGISLWVIAKDIPVEVVMAFEGMKILGLSIAYYELRTSYLELFGISLNADQSDSVKIVNATNASVGKNPPGLSEPVNLPNYCHFFRGIREGSAYFAYENHPLFDQNCALFQVVNWVLGSIGAIMLQEDIALQRVRNWEEDVRSRFKRKEVVEEAISCVKMNDQQRFFDLLW